MAQSPEALAVGTGSYIVGRYLGLKDQRPRVKEYGDREVTYQGCDVGLRTDDGTVAVGFPDRKTAESFVAGWIAEDLKAIKVRALHGVAATGPWLLWVAADVAPTGTGGFETV